MHCFAAGLENNGRKHQTEGWFGLNGPDANGRASELLAARHTLDNLSTSTHPRSLTDVNI